MKIDTTGMSESDSQTEINNVVTKIKPGKIIGVSEAIEPTQLTFSAEIDKIISLVDKEEAIIYKGLSVPQFLVQSEEIAKLKYS